MVSATAASAFPSEDEQAPAPGQAPSPFEADLKTPVACRSLDQDIRAAQEHKDSGNQLFAAQSFADAAVKYQAISELFVDLPACDDASLLVEAHTLRATALSNWAACLIKSDQPKIAASRASDGIAYLEGLNVHPDDEPLGGFLVKLYFRLAMAERTAGDIEAAIAAADRGLTLAPASASLLKERRLATTARDAAVQSERADECDQNGDAQGLVTALVALLKLRPDAAVRERLERARASLRQQSMQASLSSYADSPMDGTDISITDVPPTAAGRAAAAIDYLATVVPESYRGPKLDAAPVGQVEQTHVDRQFVLDLIDWFRGENTLHRRYALQLLLAVNKVLGDLPTCVTYDATRPGMKVAIVGDTHGQYYDLVHIFQEHGMPSDDNDVGYVFLGDYVDRGPCAIEIVLVCVAMKLAWPDRVALIRGNHEARDQNVLFGFQNQTVMAYDDAMFELFETVFESMQLAVLLDRGEERCFCAHGGIPVVPSRTWSVEELNHASVDRKRAPPTDEDTSPMHSLLWQDPFPGADFAPSKRGCGTQVGFNRANEWMEANNISRVFRGHEIEMAGYKLHWPNLLSPRQYITVFSAPDYCNGTGNTACYAVVDSGSAEPPVFKTFLAQPAPPGRRGTATMGMGLPPYIRALLAGLR
jgi:serine/threonine-protein phosphatase 5